MVYYFTPRVHPNRRSWIAPSPVLRGFNGDCDCSFPADIRSNTDGYEIRALIAGIAAEELDIQFTRDTVTIKGEHKAIEPENENFIRKELPEGKFSREFRFSEPVDAAKAIATLKDGILTLLIPKAEDAKPRSIPVKAE